MFRLIIAIFIPLIIIILSCTDNSRAPEAKLKEIKHENGLIIYVPELLNHHSIASGFNVFPEGGLDRRSPQQVRVEYINSPHIPGDWPSKKELDGRTIYSRETKHSEGSGGTEFILETSLALDNGYIKTFELIQSEFTSTPDFSMSWQVIGKAKFIQ